MLTLLIDLSWHQRGEWICEDGGWIYEKIEKKVYCFLDKNNKKKVGWGVELLSIDSFNFFIECSLIILLGNMCQISNGIANGIFINFLFSLFHHKVYW